MAQEETLQEWLTKQMGNPDRNKDKIVAIVEFFDGDIGANSLSDLATIYQTEDWYEYVEDKDSGKPRGELKMPLILWKKLNKALNTLANGGGGTTEAAASPSNNSNNNEEASETPGQPGQDTTTIAYPDLGKVVTQTKETRAYAKLKSFYEAYNPGKLDEENSIEETLQRYQGREDELFKHLEQKYILGATRQQLVYRNLREEMIEDPSIKILNRLADIYMTRIRPLEESYNFSMFHSPLMNRIDFLAKPFVLLVGQYSVGKTSFIKYLLGRDFPGIAIGPEPTTDSFIAVMHGTQNKLIPGHTVPMQQDKPFKSLLQFGDGFLSKFKCAEVNSPICESITFIDTPGILAGTKQRLGRNYDFAKVIEWFAYRADRILLLFDAHKLDISDEFKLSIEMLKGHDDKIRCILNKADQITNQQLLRVYGALMWSLGKVFKTPEVLRVYVGSFWNEPYRYLHNSELFDRESDDLISDLKGLPRHYATRKINEFMKRVRQLRVHCFICSYLKSQMPMFGKDKKKQELLNDMPNVFKTIVQDSSQVMKNHSVKMEKKYKKKRKKSNANPEDEYGMMDDKLLLQNFPDPRKFRPLIEKFDFSKDFQELDDDKLEKFDLVFQEIPSLLKDIPSIKANNNDEKSNDNEVYNPFGNNNDGNDAKIYGGRGQTWVVTDDKKKKYDNIFFGLQLRGGYASGEQVKNALAQYGENIGDIVLSKIWNLSYIDRRVTSFDSDQFALALWLIDFIKSGNKLPPSLSPPMVPPSKRYLVEIRTTNANGANDDNSNENDTPK